MASSAGFFIAVLGCSCAKWKYNPVLLVSSLDNQNSSGMRMHTEPTRSWADDVTAMQVWESNEILNCLLIDLTFATNISVARRAASQGIEGADNPHFGSTGFSSDPFRDQFGECCG